MLMRLHRCFPHIVNLCVRAGLKRLTKVIPADSAPREHVEGSDEFINDLEDDSDVDWTFSEYGELGDTVGKSRKLAGWFKGSYLRLDDLSDTIKEGLSDGTFSPTEIRDVKPVGDMDVRWSSTYLMIDRICLLHPVSVSHIITEMVLIIKYEYY